MTIRHGAAAVVLWADHVCLAQRRNPPDAGLWGYPGGHVEPGETALAAAARELREETGLIARPARLLDTLDVGGGDGPRFRLDMIACIFLAGHPRAADDVMAAGWVPVGDVLGRARPMSEHVDSILRLLLHS